MIYYILMAILSIIFFILAWYLLTGKGMSIIINPRPENQTADEHFFKLFGYIHLIFGILSIILIFVDSKIIWYSFLFIVCISTLLFSRGIVKRI